MSAQNIMQFNWLLNANKRHQWKPIEEHSRLKIQEKQSMCSFWDKEGYDLSENSSQAIMSLASSEAEEFPAPRTKTRTRLNINSFSPLNVTPLLISYSQSRKILDSNSLPNLFILKSSWPILTISSNFRLQTFLKGK